MAILKKGLSVPLKIPPEHAGPHAALCPYMHNATTPTIMHRDPMTIDSRKPAMLGHMAHGKGIPWRTPTQLQH